RANPSPDAIPLRQNRRADLIEAALQPARDRFTDAAYERLCASLALIFGTESMIVCTDVLGIDERSAREVKSSAAPALVRAAIEETDADRRTGRTGSAVHHDHHPPDPEPVGDHPEPRRPERPRHRHLHLTPLRDRIEHPVRLRLPRHR